jgi:hypothetical protein
MSGVEWRYMDLQAGGALGLNGGGRLFFIKTFVVRNIFPSPPSMSPQNVRC